MDCLKCSRGVDLNDKFCPWCGVKIDFCVVRACGKCKGIISPKSVFCCHCGADESGRGLRECGKCGREIEVGAKFCPFCGVKVGVGVTTFREMLEKVIEVTELMYDGTNILDKKLELKNVADLVKKGNKIMLEVLKRGDGLDRMSFGVGGDLLGLCGVRCSVIDCKSEKFGSVLGSLIENRIREPRCGIDLVGVSDTDLVELSGEVKRGEEDKKILISFKKKESGNGSVQTALDNMLKLVTFPIFYSKISGEIFKLGELQEKIRGYRMKYEFREQDYCESLQIGSVEVFIMGDVIEDMLFLSDITRRVDNIGVHMKNKMRKI
ncbi:MAG: hypothetical protein Hyperionvirus23_13 [Hyperionvirus sp.]|uniref:DZANK-type domain-containing protein n=1 Tax=Hyperionvirus sp. TaxID=2487770 RepID=A0A3G5AAU7_9VIRU|nr:MAG: hypothetical protein Hyperionvirus23_13 [Hyperionvirus sp.]